VLDLLPSAQTAAQTTQRHSLEARFPCKLPETCSKYLHGFEMLCDFLFFSCQGSGGSGIVPDMVGEDFLTFKR
jgi:hypothetical protein